MPRFWDTSDFSSTAPYKSPSAQLSSAKTAAVAIAVGLCAAWIYMALGWPTDYANTAEIRRSPGCDNTATASVGSGTNPCTVASGDVTDAQEYFHKNSPATYGADIAVNGIKFSDVDISSSIYDYISTSPQPTNTQVLSVIQVKLWRGAIVDVSESGRGGWYQTADHPDRRVQTDESWALMLLLYTAVLGFAAYSGVALAIGRVRDMQELEGHEDWMHPVEGREAMDVDDATSVQGKRAASPPSLPHHAHQPDRTNHGQANEPPPAIGDEAGLNTSDMWK